MYELGIYGDIANACAGFTAIWMAHRLYRSPRKPWQVVTVWTSLMVLWMLGAQLLWRLVPVMSYERCNEILWLTGLCAYVYLFTQIPLCQRIFTFCMTETALALIAMMARVLSVSLTETLGVRECVLFLGIFLVIMVGFCVYFALRMQYLILENLEGLGNNLQIMALFSAIGYGVLLMMADPWSAWDKLEVLDVLEWVGVILFVIVAYVVAFRALRAIQDQNTSDNDAKRMAEQLDLSEEYYKTLVEKMDLARSYNHDMHYHVEILNGLSAAGDLAGMQQYVADMGRDLPGSLPTQYCEMGAVNALLDRYAKICMEKHIQLRCQLRIPPSTAVHPIHLCVIFGNALQNAVEAMERLPQGQERWIEVKANQQEGRMAIQVSNPCPERPVIQGSSVKSTKKEPGHGMGLENIRTAAQRYDGWSGASWENGIFMLNIELRNV